MLNIVSNNGTANTVIARAEDAGDEIVFRVRKAELVSKGKASKTGQSQGVMLKLNHEFEYEIEGTPAVVAVSAGRGGAGTWFSLKPYPLAETEQVQA